MVVLVFGFGGCVLSVVCVFGGIVYQGLPPLLNERMQECFGQNTENENRSQLKQLGIKKKKKSDQPLSNLLDII